MDAPSPPSAAFYKLGEVRGELVVDHQRCLPLGHSRDVGSLVSRFEENIETHRRQLRRRRRTLSSLDTEVESAKERAVVTRGSCDGVHGLLDARCAAMVERDPAQPVEQRHTIDLGAVMS